MDAKRARFDVTEEDMKRHLECPICFEIPRDGVMLQCRNGHNVCAACKKNLGGGAKCPQAGCDYLDPPTRNRTVAGLVDCLPFAWPCKYAKSAGCTYEGAKPELDAHEAGCECRPVPCPARFCNRPFPAKTIVGHCQIVHKAELIHVPNAFDQWFLWRGSYVDDSLQTRHWKEHLFATGAGEMLLCSHYENGLVYFWVVALAGKAVADRLRCKISFGVAIQPLRSVNAPDEAKCSKTVVVPSPPNAMWFTTPVFPIDWSRQKIMKDPDCMSVSPYSIRKMLSKNVTEEERQQLADGKFNLKLNIVKYTA
jgi:hypothetical protein